MAKKIDFPVGFVLDKTGLKELDQILTSLYRKSIGLGGGITDDLKEAGQAAKQLSDILNRSYNKDLGTVNIANFNKELQKSGMSVSSLQTSLLKAGSMGANAFNKLGSTILNTNVQLKQSNKLLDDMAKSMANTVKWGIASGIFNTVTNSIQKAYDYTVKLDTSLNDIRIVSNKSADDMERFAVQANNAAKALGASTLDYTKASTIYYQQGLSDEEVAARTDVTLKAANVTGQKSADVSEQLTAIWNGYKVSAQEAELYIDKVAKVAASTAADLEEMATGMSKVASAANSAGVDIDQLNGMLATVVSVTREAPETIGTSFRSIFARIGDLALGGEDEYGVTLGKVSGQMQELGIQILDQQGEMRNMGDIVEDLAAKWQTWTQAQRQAAAVAIAGKQQYSRLIALMDNWGMYQQAVQDSQGAVGELQREQDIYMESTAAKLKILKATWEDLYKGIINKGEVNSGIDLLTNLVQTFDNFIDSFGGGVKSITALGAIISNIFDKQIGGAITNAIMNSQKLQQNIELLEQKKAFVQAGSMESSGSPTGIADQAQYETEIKYAQQIQELGKNISNEQYNQLTNLQQQIGALEREAVLIEEQSRLESQKILGEKEASLLAKTDIEDLQAINDLYYEKFQQQEKIVNDAEKYKNEVKQIISDLKKENAYMEEIEESQYNLLKLTNKIQGEDAKELKNLMSKANLSELSERGQQKVLKILDKIIIQEKESLKIEQNKADAAERQFQARQKASGIRSKKGQIDIEFQNQLDLDKQAANIQARVSAITSSLSTLVMSWSSVNSLFQTWNDETASFSDKMTQTFMTMGMAIPTLISSFKNLNDALNKGSSILDVFKAKKTLNNALDEAGIVISGKKTQEAVKEAIVMQQVNKHYEKRGIDIATVTAAELAETKAKAANWIMTNKQAAALKSATAAQTAFNASLLANPLTWVIVALGAAVAGIAAYTAAQEKAREAQIAQNNKEMESIDTIKSEREELDKLYDTYIKAYSIYERTGTGKEELTNVTNALAKALGVEGEMVGGVAQQYDILLGKMDEAADKALSESKKDTSAAIGNLGYKENYNVNLYSKTQGKKYKSVDFDFGWALEKNDKEIFRQLEDAFNKAGIDYTTADKSMGTNVLPGSYFVQEQDLVKAYNALLTLRNQKNDTWGKEDAEVDEAINKWLDANEQYIKKYQEAQNNINSAIMTKASVATQKEGLKETDITKLDEYNQYIEAYKKNLEKIFLENGIERSSEEINTITKDFVSKSDTLSYYQKLEDKRESWVKKFGEQDRGKIAEQIDKLSADELEIFITFDVDEQTSDENIQEYIQLAQARAKYDKSLKLHTFADDIYTLLASGKQMSDLNKDQLAEVSYLEKEYKELGNILDKNSNEYLDKLIQIREQEEENAIKAKQATETLAINEAFKIDIDADTQEFENKLKDIAEADYNVLVEVKTDIQDDFDSLVNIMDNMETMASKIGDDFIIAASDIEEMGDTFPGILNNMKLLSDGTAQLSQESVQNAMASAQQEVEISKQATIDKLKDQQAEMESKQAAAQTIAGIAHTLAAQETDSAKLSADQQGAINEALNTLKEDNTETTATYEKDSQVDVAETAKQNSSSMANSFAQAYQKMADDSQKWAETAKQNLIVASTGQGNATTTSLNTGWSSTSGSGTVTTANKGQLTGEVNADTNVNWGDVANYYDQLAEAYGQAANNIQGKIGEILARDNKLNTATKNIAKGLGADGKSSKEKDKGGSKQEPDEMDALEDEKDIYHDIDIILQQITTDLDRLEKQQDKLFGQDLIENLNKQLEKLEEHISAINKKIEIARGEAAGLQSQLAGQGVAFNADGTISNYSNAYNSQLNYVNSVIAQYNSMSKEAQESFKETVEKAKKDFDTFIDNINKYDTLITETIPGLEDDIQSAIDKQIEIRIEEFTMEIKIRLDMSEAERDWNEFRRKVIDGVKDTDILGNVRARLRDFNSYYNSESIGEVQSLMKQVQNTQTQLEQIDRTGWSDFYGDNRAQALEDLKSYNDQLMKSMEDVEDLIEEIKESYLDMMDEAADRFEDQVGMYEQVKDIIDHDMNIIKLVYGEDSYTDLEKYYQMQEDNNNKQLDFLRQQKDFWYAQMQTLEQGSEEWEKAKENWMDAVSEWNSKVEEAVENIQDKYLNAINKIFDELNNKVTSGAGLDYVSDEWELINQNADQYLDTINSLYDIQSLENKYLDAIDKTDNLSAQRKLNDLMNEELNALREKDKLTQYDIDRANMKYEIALKQIALEEAQQNKSTMRLRRDSQGNYTYQYVADNDQIGQLQDELTTLKNELYNFDLEHYRDNLDQVLEIYQEFQEKMKEAAQINDPEERAAMELLLQEQYGELINGLVEQNETIRLNLHESAFTELADLYNTDLNNFQSLTSEEQEVLLGQMIPQWDSGIQHMADTFAGEGGFVPTCKDAMEQLNAATETYEQDLNQVQQAAGQDFGDVQRGIDDTKTKTEELIQDNGVLIQTYQDQLNEVRKVINELQSLCSQYNAVKIAAQQAAEAAYNYWKAVNNQAANAAGNNVSGGSSNSGNSSSNSRGSNNSSSGEAGSVGGDGATVGNQITYSGSYYYDSFGTKPSGSKYSGVADGVTIDIVNNNPYGIHIKSSDGRYLDLGWIKRNQVTRWNTGGYTGDWGDDSGRLAILDRKELILNKDDTANMLNILQLTRDFMNSMNNVLLSRMINSVNGAPNTGMGMVNEDTLEQNVHIDATFPNVKDAREVEEALNNLVNVASQRIGRNTKR